MPRSHLRIAVAVAVGIAAVVLLLTACSSLHWRYVRDSPLMIYTGFLVAGGAVPYRDFFDMNMPGTYFIMWAFGRVFGWNDLGFRIFDLLCLASISASTFLWMRPTGRLPAFAASVAFPLWYLLRGPSLSLQREYIALVPFTAMLAIATSDTAFKPGLRALVSGLLAGVAFLIKPHFLLLSLPILIVLLQHGATSPGVRRRFTALVGGISIPLGAAFLYLLCTGSLEPFMDMAVNYWPLYTHMTGTHTPISGVPRLLYIVNSTWKGVTTAYTPMAVVGLVVLIRDPRQRRYSWMMSGLLIAAAIYPAMAGQFWGYHWIPFYYILFCAASLAARPVEGWGIGGIAPAVVVLFLLFWLSSHSIGALVSSQQGGGGDDPPKGGVPDEIGRFLRSHLRPGDTVQPLDWTGGAVHGMLMARAPLATRFMYDFHFYHHINSPYVARLRREFMNELGVRQPRFIIQVFEDKPWPAGTNTTREFPDLQAFLERRYTTAQQGGTYRILERRDGTPGTVPADTARKLVEPRR
jgi:hypothetical protein